MNIHAIIKLVERYGEACADIADATDPANLVSYLNARDERLTEIRDGLLDLVIANGVDGHEIGRSVYLPAYWDCSCGARGNDGQVGVDDHLKKQIP